MHYRLFLPLLLLSCFGVYARSAGVVTAEAKAPLVKVQKSYLLPAAQTPPSAVLTERDAQVTPRQIMVIYRYSMLPVPPQDNIYINQNNWINGANYISPYFGGFAGFQPFNCYTYYPSAGYGVYGPYSAFPPLYLPAYQPLPPYGYYPR